MTGHDAQASEPARDEPVRRLARGGMINLAGSLWSALAQFLLVSVVARRTDETTTGAFFVVISVVVLVAAVPNLGAGTGLIYFLSRHRENADWSRVRPTIRHGLWPVAIGSLLCAVILVALAGPVATVIGLASVEGAPTAIRVSACAVVATTMTVAITSALRGLGNIRATVIHYQVLQPTLQLALAALAASSGLVALVAGWSLPTVVAAVACAVVLARWLHDRRADLSAGSAAGRALRSEAGREVWGYSAPLAVVSLLKMVIQRIDVVLLSALRSPAEVALYVAASRYLVLGQVVNRAMNWTVQPRIARSLAAGDRDSARRSYAAVTAWLILASWPISLGCLIFPGALLEIVGGPSYRAATGAILILSAAMLVAAACGNVESVLAMAGRSRVNLVLTLGSTALNIGLLIILIPLYGLLGAAVAWAASVVISNALPLVLAWRMERLHPLGRPATTAMLVSLVSTAAVGSVIRLWLGDTLTALVVAVPLCGAVHLALIRVNRRPLALSAAIG